MVIYREPLVNRLDLALEARGHLVDDRHESAFRLFKGFYEGWPKIVFDLYGQTIVAHNHMEDSQLGHQAAERGLTFILEKWPWITTAVLKTRRADSPAARNGIIVYGTKPNHWIREYGIRYAIDLQLNRDASFYLDTRLLRRWILDHLAGKTVLNTFAYTGSLGVAAVGGGAERVIHTDLNKSFLNIAKSSYTLNGFPIDKKLFQTGDFWSHMNRLKRAGEQFDCVILDPPFFSSTEQGRVDLAQNVKRLINKVRPLVKSGGRLVAINNALFVKGRAYLDVLEEICRDGYVEIERFIPVPDDITGYPTTQVDNPPVDPSPFNHPTKIVILKIRHAL